MLSTSKYTAYLFILLCYVIKTKTNSSIISLSCCWECQTERWQVVRGHSVINSTLLTYQSEESHVNISQYWLDHLVGF